MKQEREGEVGRHGRLTLRASGHSRVLSRRETGLRASVTFTAVSKPGESNGCRFGCSAAVTLYQRHAPQPNARHIPLCLPQSNSRTTSLKSRSVTPSSPGSTAGNHRIAS